jgi:hypothetical protein
MSDPTPAQYKMAVEIGHSVCTAFASGASHAQVITTLRHALTIAESNSNMGIPEAAFASPRDN